MNPTHGLVPAPTYAIVIDEERKAAGWGNHFAVVEVGKPSAFLFLGGKDEAERRLARLNRPQVLFGTATVCGDARASGRR